MISVVIATHESERALVHTLAALVPGALAGVVREVIVADAGSRDDTAKVADVAGCRFMVHPAARAARGSPQPPPRRAPTGCGSCSPAACPSTSWIDETRALRPRIRAAPVAKRRPRCSARGAAAAARDSPRRSR